jgi:lactoylglutathione lyase
MATFASSTNNPQNFSWQQTMLRIKDPKITVPFFLNHFGFTLIHTYNFPQWGFSLYFLAILPAGQTYTLVPGSKDAEDFLWSTDLTTLELTHNHGSEVDDSFAVNNGNVEPHRGFGHIALMTPDVYAACAELETAGVKFQKKPDDGRMKGLAFVLSPEGYWIEIIRRAEQAEARSQGLKYTFAQVLPNAPSCSDCVTVRTAHSFLVATVPSCLA